MRPPFRVILALCQRRLEARLLARVGWLLATMGASAFVIVAAVVADALELQALVGDGLHWLCWLGAGPVALAAAASPVARDRREGIHHLCVSHGVDEQQLSLARGCAAMIACAKRVAGGGTIMCVLVLAIAPSMTLLLHAMGALGVAIAISAAVGLLAAACGSIVEVVRS